MSIRTPITEWPPKNLAQGLTILDIADMIRRDGTGLYSDAGLDGASYRASLCGLTAAYGRGGNVMMIKGHNLHVVVDLRETPVDDGDGVEYNSKTRMDVMASYLQGDIATLDSWHRHLSAYRRSMRPSGAATAAA